MYEDLNSSQNIHIILSRLLVNHHRLMNAMGKDCVVTERTRKDSVVHYSFFVFVFLADINAEPVCHRGISDKSSRNRADVVCDTRILHGVRNSKASLFPFLFSTDNEMSVRSGHR